MTAPKDDTGSTDEMPPITGDGPAATTPGLVLVWSRDRARVNTVPMDLREPFVVGRDRLSFPIDDTMVSREHARVTYDGVAWTVEDLGSRNGTFVDGERVVGRTTRSRLRTLRLGATLFLPVIDLLPYAPLPEDLREGTSEGFVRGAAQRRSLSRLGEAAREGSPVLVVGETGTGKEGYARAYHAMSRRPKGPFVALNCANLDEEVATALLFGSRRGAYTGATDQRGHFRSADGGTLFLDELGELPRAVQAKLLRTLEQKTAMPVGGLEEIPVDVQVCAATNADVERDVESGKFREDLYYRLAQTVVRIPPLRERPEEIPFFLQQFLPPGAPSLSALFVEQALWMRWPGNVRGVSKAMNDAVSSAKGRGASALSPTDFDDKTSQAGTVLGDAPPKPPPVDEQTELVRRVYRECDGNMEELRKRLGVGKTKAYELVREAGVRK